MTQPKLNPVEIIRAFIQIESVEQGNPLFIIEREFQEYVKLHAEFILNRYEAMRLEHFKEKERKNIRLGLCGQKAFELLLQLLEVPYVPNDPIIDQRLSKDYDFLIPTLGKIEVKTEFHYARKVIVKISEWHGNDFLVAWQMNEAEDRLRMLGWLSKQKVESHPKTPRGTTKYNPHSDAYIIDFAELNPPETFIEMLKEAKKRIFHTAT